jgi:hypothetical protein
LPTPEVIEVTPTVWLIDVDSGEVVSLVDRDEEFPIDVRFEDGGVTAVRYPAYEVRFAADGTELFRNPEEPVCRPLPLKRTEIGGVEFDNAACGDVSPGGRWQPYTVVTGEVETSAGYRVPQYDQWVLDAETGARRQIATDMRHSLGTDWWFGSAWSPDARYYVYAESFGEFANLTDLEAVTTIALPSGTGTTDKPNWSPDSTAMLHRGSFELENAEVWLQPLPVGELRHIDALNWPATFDGSGRYAYSPAWYTPGPGDEPPPPETVVVDLSTGDVVTRLPGAPATHFYTVPPSDPPVRVVDGRVVAALEHVSGPCAYDTVYIDSEAVACLTRALFPAISPDGTKIAFARPSGTVNRVRLPTFVADRMTIYDVVVYDIATDSERVLASGAVSGTALLIRWSPDGTHVTALWPAWVPGV